MHPTSNSRQEITDRQHHDRKEHLYSDTSQIQRVFELYLKEPVIIPLVKKRKGRYRYKVPKYMPESA